MLYNLSILYSKISLTYINDIILYSNTIFYRFHTYNHSLFILVYEFMGKYYA